MRRWIMVILIFALSYSVLSGCSCEHKWQNATCELPETCEICHETRGSAKGHDWNDATCEEAKNCKFCGAIDGDPLGHTVTQKATCERDARCSVCNQIVEYALRHQWQEATRKSPERCSVCQKTRGEPLSALDVYPEGIIRHNGKTFLLDEADYMELFNELKNRGSLFEIDYLGKDLSMIGNSNLSATGDNSYSLMGTDGQRIRFIADQDTNKLRFIILELAEVSEWSEDNMAEYLENVVIAYMAANGCVDAETVYDALEESLSVKGSANVSTGCLDGVAFRLEVRYHYMTMEIWVQGE